MCGYGSLMIPFDKIDERLSLLGKDRAWLAEKTNRAASSIGTSLAPNADEKNRSERLQRDLTAAIEAEESRQAEAMKQFKNQPLVLELTREEFRAWNAAAMFDGKLIEDWALDALKKLAADHAKPKPPEDEAGTDG